MVQKISPFIEAKYGWDFGESGWNSGADENWLKFSFLLSGTIDAIVDTLPAPVNGKGYFLNTDNRLYFVVGGSWISSPTPLWTPLSIKDTGETFIFNGVNLNPAPNLATVGEDLATVTSEIESLGTAARENVEYFATQAQLDIVSSQANSYTDELRDDLLSGDLELPSTSITYRSGNVEVALDNSPVYSASLAELEALPTTRLIAGQLGFVRDCAFRWDGGAWIPVSAINPIIFGADPTGTTDSSGPIQAAADYCVLHGVPLESGPSDEFLLTSQVNLRYVKGVSLKGRLLTDTDDFIPVLAGYTSTNRNEWTVEIKEILWRNRPGIGVDPANLPANPLLRIVGCKNTDFKLGNIDSIQLYADSDDVTTDSISYCTFRIQQCEKLELTTNPAPTGTLVQWINENKFFGGRIRRIILGGTYNHNHNIWFAPTIETNGMVKLNVGSSNRVWDARFEGEGIKLEMGAPTHNNIVIQSWVNTARDGVTALGGNVDVTDDGVGNIVIRDQQAWMDRIPMFSLGFGQPLESAQNQSGVRAASLLAKNGNYWRINTAAQVFESQMIPCVAGMGFDIRGSENLWRAYITFYDDAGNQITSASDPLLLSSGSFTWSTENNRYQRVTNFAEIPSIPVILTKVGYVRVEITAGSSTTGVDIKRLSLTAVIPKGVSQAAMAACSPKWL